MAVMHTTTISASITAYSTAVGPLSSFTKLTNALVKLFIVAPRSCLFRKPFDRSYSTAGITTDRRRPQPKDNDSGSTAATDGRIECRVGERARGTGPQGGDGGDAHHDDQG